MSLPAGGATDSAPPLSQSFLATSQAEARYRIQAPNSGPRAIMVIGVDEPAAELVERLAGLPWSATSFFVAGAPEAASGFAPGADGRSVAEWFRDLSGHAANLLAQIDQADLVFLIATAGEQTHVASLVGEACLGRKVNTGGLIVHRPGVPDARLSATLLALRPWVATLGVVTQGDYAIDMLHALGA